MPFPGRPEEKAEVLLEEIIPLLLPDLRDGLGPVGLHSIRYVLTVIRIRAVAMAVFDLLLGWPSRQSLHGLRHAMSVAGI